MPPKSKPVMHNDPNLIVTRGLEEILENDRKKKAMGTSKKAPLGRPPKTILCYLCGKGFGTTSISIHRPQCYLKQMIAWERGERREKPIDPKTHEKNVQEKIDAVRAREAGVDNVPVGRRMEGRSETNYTDDDWDMYNRIQQDTAFSRCPHCDRTFLPDRLEIHLRSCRPGHTAKPVKGKGEAAAATTTTTTTTTVSGSGRVAPKPTYSSSSSSATANRSAGNRSSTLNSSTSPNSTTYSSSSGTGSSAAKTSSRQVAQPIPEDEGEQDELIAYEKGQVEHNTLVHYTSVVKENDLEQDEVVDQSNKPLTSVFDDMRKDKVNRKSPLPPPPPTTVEVQDSPRSPKIESVERVTPASRTSVSSTAAKPASSAKTSAAPAKKIQMNNVSHFKKVESRIQVDHSGPAKSSGNDEVVARPARRGMESTGAAAKSSKLCACQHCGRTFAPDRIGKHESCCIEKNAKTSPPSSPGVVKTVSPSSVQVKPTTSTILQRKAAADKTVLYCGDCGAKLAKRGQVFCNACGNKTT